MNSDGFCRRSDGLCRRHPDATRCDLATSPPASCVRPVAPHAPHASSPCARMECAASASDARSISIDRSRDIDRSRELDRSRSVAMTSWARIRMGGGAENARVLKSLVVNGRTMAHEGLRTGHHTRMPTSRFGHMAHAKCPFCMVHRRCWAQPFHPSIVEEENAWGASLRHVAVAVVQRVRLVGREARWIRGVEGVGVAARGRGIHRRGWSRKRRRA